MKIVQLDQTNFNKYELQIKEIFFESSAKKEFSTDEEKERFYQKWTSFYFENIEAITLVALDAEKVLGYLMGHPDSKNCTKLYTQNSNYELFEDQFKGFPAHLLINCR